MEKRLADYSPDEFSAFINDRPEISYAWRVAKMRKTDSDGRGARLTSLCLALLSAFLLICGLTGFGTIGMLIGSFGIIAVVAFYYIREKRHSIEDAFLAELDRLPEQNRPPSHEILREWFRRAEPAA